MLGEARTVVAARPAMAVAVAGVGEGWARVGLLWRQDGVGLQNRGHRGLVWPG